MGARSLAVGRRSALPCGGASAGWRATCRSCARPCRRPRTDQPSNLKRLAGLGNVLEHRQGEAGDGRIIAVVGQSHAEPVGRAGRRSPRPTPASCRPRARRSGGSSPSSRSLANAPASAASRSSPGVTMPSRWPYSSWTSASGTSAARSTASASIASIRSGMTGAGVHQLAQGRARSPSSRAASMSRVGTTPTILSTEPSATGRRLCGVAASARADFLAARSRCRSSRCRCAESSPRAPAGRRGGRCRR